MLTVCQFTLNTAELAQRVYRDYSHRTTPWGVIIPQNVRQELKRFLEEYLRFIGSDEHQFLRIDAFVGEQTLKIIEVNVELQDGWGVALNLLRASGNTLSIRDNKFPTEIIAYSNDYLSEFELAQSELARIGKKLDIIWWSARPNIPKKSPLDSKLYLANFCRIWQGNQVLIPKMYCCENTAWEQLPEDVVFKFCHKYSRQSLRAGYSVARRKTINKGRFMRQCYMAGQAVAQERIEPFRLDDGSVTQLVLMCSGSDPITGYLQVAPPNEFIINDRTACKGPLVFK